MSELQQLQQQLSQAQQRVAELEQLNSQLTQTLVRITNLSYVALSR
jgi:prefoldin subunit 5